jgi:PAS domain S-box-containing protein
VQVTTAPLTEEHQDLLQLLNAAPVGFISTNLKGDIALANAVAAKLLMPLSQDGEMTNLFAVLERVAPDVRLQVARFSPSHGSICDSMQIQVEASDGERAHPTTLSLTVTKIDEGNLIASLSDVTAEYAMQHTLHLQQTKLEMQNEELIRSEQALEAARARYFDLYDLAPVGYLTVNESWEIMEANLTAATLLDVGRGALVKAPFSRYILKQDADSFHLLCQRLMATGVTQVSDCRMVKSDGTQIWVDLTATAAWESSIPVQRITISDITARKQIEEERKKLDQRLRDQQFYTRSLIEANIDAIMTTDPAGIITDVNRQMESLTDCTRDELIGAPFETYFTDPKRAQAAISLALSNKKVTDYELTARTRDGLETVVSFNAVTFYDRDRYLQGVFASARDVTERKRLDQVLKEKNVELEGARLLADRANLAKSDFLSSMSHELRSPLNAILGFAQLLESESPPPTLRQQASIAQILRAGWHLLNLINEILDLTKIESGQIPLSNEPVSLAEIMLECHSMLENQAQQHGVTLIFPSAMLPFFVLADRTRLKQVVINLLTNAIKYNQLQGVVEVSCTPGAPGCVRVSLRDTGIGLNPEQLSQLFQAFNRLGQETGGVEGTGIGLVVTKQLVELMGGRIGVESQIGVGSVFWFELVTATQPPVTLDSQAAAIATVALDTV